MASCRECYFPIRFIRMEETGKSLPVDPAPDEDGRVVARRVGGRLTGRVLKQDEQQPAGWSRWQAHHATCAGRPRGGTTRGAPKPLTLFDPQPEGDTR